MSNHNEEKLKDAINIFRQQDNNAFASTPPAGAQCWQCPGAAYLQTGKMCPCMARGPMSQVRK